MLALAWHVSLHVRACVPSTAVPALASAANQLSALPALLLVQKVAERSRDLTVVCSMFAVRLQQRSEYHAHWHSEPTALVCSACWDFLPFADKV